MFCRVGKNDTTRSNRIPYEKIPPNPPLTKGGTEEPLFRKGMLGSYPPFVKGGRGDFGRSHGHMFERTQG